MDWSIVVGAVLLGIVEGLTEFLPVSSTGHLILFDELLGFEGPPGHVFEIVIQLGAILAICWLYRARLFAATRGVLSDPVQFRFARNLALAVAPALAAGAVFAGKIKEYLFDPWVVAAMLVVGGVAILWIERHVPPARHREVEDFPPGLAFKIGLCQVLSMVPGVSRAGATIMGALLLGVERRAATEFSFFLAIPTMVAATSYDLFKNRALLDGGNALVIAIGFVVAFVSALAVVRWFVGFVSRHDFTPFAWYRIAVGAVMLALLALR